MTTEIVAKLFSAVMNELECVGEQNSCILASAALNEALGRMNVNSSVLTVRVMIFNPTYHDRIKSHGMPDDATRRQWEADGCRGVAIGIGSPPKGNSGWPGHLVVVVPTMCGGRHGVIDLTLPQASKPEWNINLKAGAMQVPDAFVTGKDEHKVVVNGCLLVYKAFPDDKSFESAPVWQNSDLWKRIC